MAEGVVKFDVKMTDKAMYDFLLYHTYTKVSGMLGVMFGFLMFLVAFRQLAQKQPETSVFFFFLAFFFLVFTPVILWKRAKEQVKHTPMFQEPIHYELNQKGVAVSQGEQKTLNKWKDFEKAVATNQSIILYVTRMRAIIFPRKDMGEQYTAAVSMIYTHMPAAKVKIRQVR